jgi:hypothetical protein
MKASDLLIEGRSRVKKGWCKGAFTFDKAGKETSTRSVDANQWCSVGAIFGALQIIPSSTPYLEEQRARCLAEEYLADAAGLPSVEHIFGWNDDPCRTQEEVVAAYDKAIELAAAAGD